MSASGGEVHPRADPVDILLIALSAMLRGAESFNDMEDFGLAKESSFRTILDLRNGISIHATFHRHARQKTSGLDSLAQTNETQGATRPIPKF